MKKIFLLILAVLMIFSACSGNNPQVKAIQDRGILRVGVKVDVPRFGYLNPATNEMEGMEIDIAKMIAKNILDDENLIKFVYLSAQTRGPLLNNGEVDLVIATFTITEERKKNFNFSTPYYTDKIGLIVKKDSGLEKMADMSGKSIGVVQSGTAHESLVKEAERLGIEVSFKEYSSYPEIKAALSADKINAFAADKLILFGYLDDETVICDEGFDPQNYGIATKLENKKLAEYIDNLVNSMLENGKLQEIYEKWGL